MFKLKVEEIGEARGEARKEQEFRDKYIASIRKLLSKHSIPVSSEQAEAIKALSTDDLVQLQDGLIFDRITSSQQLQDWFGDKPAQQSTSERAEGIIAAIENKLGSRLGFERYSIKKLSSKQLDELDWEIDNITEPKDLDRWLSRNSKGESRSPSASKKKDLDEPGLE